MNYAGVAVSSPGSRSTFCYAIPPGLNINVGQPVWVPFGPRIVQGIVLQLSDEPAVEETKEIAGIITDSPPLSPIQTKLAQWISEGRPVTVYGDGTQSRDFTYVDDIVEGTIAGLRPLGYEIFNLGSDRPVVLMDLIRLVEETVEKQAVLDYFPPHPADVTATWADIGKARRLLDWEPQTDLRKGVAALLAWYREQRSWAKDITTS
jgi:hypothetical protein